MATEACVFARLARDGILRAKAQHPIRLKRYKSGSVEEVNTLIRLRLRLRQFGPVVATRSSGRVN